MPNRQLLIAELEQFAQRYPSDQDRAGRFIDFVNAHPDCAARELAVGHLTGAAWLVDPGGARVLLTHHRKLQRWLQLGGHADGDLDLAAVALKEAQEESGLPDLQLLQPLLDIDDHPIPANARDPAHVHYDLRYVVIARGSLQPTISDESLDLRWWPVSDLTESTWEPSLRRMAVRWLTQREHWLGSGQST